MPTVTFVGPDGSRTSLQAADGESLMQIAVANGISGIVAECGGAAACATCHVYVDDDFAGRLEPCSEMEDEMLEYAASPRTERSRLACQVKVGQHTDGMVVTLPQTQG